MAEDEEFRDALDDFPFYDCEEAFFDPITSHNEVSISVSNPKASPEDLTEIPVSLRRRRALSSSGGDSIELSRPSSSVSFENFVNSRERKVRLSSETKECEKKSKNEMLDSVELKHRLEDAKDVVNVENKEQNDERSTVTDANNDRGEELVSGELDLRANNEAHSSLLFTLAGIIIKAVGFQINVLVKIFATPIWLIYYLYMLVFDPFGFLRRYLIRKTKNFVLKNVSPFVYEWLREHKAIWKKCGWGLLWSAYVCAVLVGLLVLAFVMGGLLIKGVVEEPVRMKRSLNFDYTEKSPIALVPMIAHTELSHDIYLGDKPEIGKNTGSRVIPHNHKLQATVLLTLPESDYNQNLGIFQVRVDFLSTHGKTLASSKRPCMLQYRSLPIRLLLTFLKVAPILTGYTSETQNLKINFRGFTEGENPTAYLRVVIEQRAEFMPGAGIPEIYTASLTLESELPLLKNLVWVWKKTFYVWISMTIFTMELVFALICCKPIIIPKIRLKEATNRGASQSDLPSQS
ncbi:hypothetical protein BUALT_Bualt03G0037500 [Buddleja alternifolia]|uniref:Seipin n=1 Tax=Buddleja alternifolia TaxID=168488 RepID=A0AAV6XVA6_9LAMI|nr:hypothetical protein BUALT_Bualt03G0037500 [Buddleja alternifolia]